MSNTYLLSLGWGLGDVLCCTPAIRALKEREPDCTIVFRTFIKGRHRLEYDPPGGGPGSGGAPDEMLWYNPRIAHIIDMDDRAPDGVVPIEMYYVKVGGPSLDVPLQARFFDRLDLPWNAETRFDNEYYMRPSEIQTGGDVLRSKAFPSDVRFCALTPRVGWPGKAWTDPGWAHIIARLRETGWTPVVLAGRRIIGKPWDEAVNLSGTLDIRQAAGVLSVCQAMLCTEGGLMHVRFALGRPAVVMTCATKIGLQVWAPPEFYTEFRNDLWCEPCMWRLRHVKGEPGCPPGNTHDCPVGKTLRDVGGEDVWAALEEHLALVAP